MMKKASSPHSFFYPNKFSNNNNLKSSSSTTTTLNAVSPTLGANQTVKSLRSQGRKVLHMGFGESPFPVPPILQKALQEATFRKDYIDSAGELQLREQVLKYYCQDKKILPLPQGEYDCIISVGSKMTLFLLQMAIGGDLLACDPSWVSYQPQAWMLKQKVFVVPATLHHGVDSSSSSSSAYKVDVNQLRQVIHDARKNGGNPTKMIINFPNNPTGLQMPDENMKELAQVLQDEGIILISDEIYGFTSFEGKDENTYRSFARYTPENVIVTSGLSKHLSLGGWRVGVGLIPKALKDESGSLFSLLSQLQSETTSCLPSPISQAALVGYQNLPEVEQHIAKCTRLHNVATKFVAEGFRKAIPGLHCPTPSGAFYCYPDFSKHADKMKQVLNIEAAQDLADHLAEEYGLVALPANCFLSDDKRLALRCACQDYDGAEALKNFDLLAELGEEEFVAKYMPNLVECVKVFEDVGKKILCD